MSKIKLGITIGDVNGIGPEIIIKALSKGKILNYCTPVIYGSSKVLAYYKNIVKDSNFSFFKVKSAERLDSNKINVINITQDDINIEIGNITKESGAFAKLSIDAAIEDAKKGFLDAIVTSPINKKAMSLADFNENGHTEYLTKHLEAKSSLMLMVSNEVRVATLTNHIPVKDVAPKITKELILKKITLFKQSLQKDFGIEKPSIAVLGLNPHAGDGGLIGDEEENIIRPTIIEAKKSSGVLISGPFSADGFFSSGKFTKVDGILSMYHDQGLIPFKILSGTEGVNFTAGLPVVRTSPDHGTAMEIAGKNIADEGSFLSALYKAIEIAKNRKQYKEDNKNPLRKKEILEEDPNAGKENIVDES